MSVKPLQDRVLVKRLEEENKTAGGIIIPDNSKEKPAQGEIVAIGSGYRNTDGTLTALEVKVGDRVLFEKYGHSDVKLEGHEYLIMKESSILGILN
jgi:chaperonin GroES